MLEIKEAYELLGLREGTDKEEVKRRYGVLQKQYLYKKSQGQLTEEEEDRFQEISRAYGLLMGEEPAEDIKPSGPEKDAKAETKFGRLLSFFKEYKYHIAAGLFIVFVAVFLGRDFINRPKPDLGIIIAGNVAVANSEKLSQLISEKIPEVDQVLIKVAYIPDKNNPFVAKNELPMIMTMVYSKSVDVMILDRPMFDELFGKELFKSLDELAEKNDLDVHDHRDYLRSYMEDSKPSLYGINVKDSEILKVVYIQGEEKIAAIVANTERRKNAEKFLELLLK